jgi:hypothetical protein
MGQCLPAVIRGVELPECHLHHRHRNIRTGHLPAEGLLSHHLLVLTHDPGQDRIHACPFCQRKHPQSYYLQYVVRKDYKFREYQHSRGGLKITLKKGAEMTPLKSVFRIFNPDETYDDMLQRLQK